MYYSDGEIPMYAKGGLSRAAHAARGAGRYGDTELVHVNKDELAKMREMWGDPTINPETGMPEFFLGKLFKTLLPIAVSFIPGVGPIAGAALRAGAGAASGALDGGGLKGALSGAVGGAMGAPGGASAVGTSALGNSVGSVLGNSALAKDVGNVVVNAAPAVVDRALNSPADKFAAPLEMPDRSRDAGAGRGPLQIFGMNTNVRPTSASPEVVRRVREYARDYAVGGYVDDDRAFAGPLDNTTNGFLGGNFTPNVLGSTDWRKAASMTPAAIMPGDQPPPPRGPFPEKENWFSRSSLIKGIPNGLLVGGALSLLPLLFRKDDDDEEDIGRRISTFQQRGYAGGGDVQGPGDGRSDEIPAQLSDGEYVIDAETVALLGNGSTKAGAKRLDDFRVNIRKHKGGNLARGKFSHDAKPPERYMRGGAY